MNNYSFKIVVRILKAGTWMSAVVVSGYTTKEKHDRHLNVWKIQSKTLTALLSDIFVSPGLLIQTNYFL